MDSLSANDRAVWRTIRKEFEEIGISVAAFDANRNFIFDWCMRAVETGAFEEQNVRSTNDESQYSDEQERESNEADDGSDMGRQIVDSNSESFESNHGGRQLERQQSSKSAHESGPIPPKHGSTLSDRTSASTYPRQRAVMSRPRQRLMKAVTTSDFSKAHKILEDEASSHLLDIGTLDRALWSATSQVELRDSYPLLAKLIAQGANVNYVSSDDSERTPLWNSVANGSFNTLRLLVESGADVKYTGSSRSPFREARDFAPRAALKQNPAMLRLLISSGVDVNVLYLAADNDFRPPIFDYMTDDISLIHEAASLGAVSALKALLEHGAEIDAASPRCGTPLMFALLNQQIEAAEFLLVRGADPNFYTALEPPYTKLGYGPTSRYKTPIEAAMVGGNASMVRLLLKKGAVPGYSTLDFVLCVTEYGKGGRLRDYGEDQEIMEMLEEAVERERDNEHSIEMV